MATAGTTLQSSAFVIPGFGWSTPFVDTAILYSICSCKSRAFSPNIDDAIEVLYWQKAAPAEVHLHELEDVFGSYKANEKSYVGQITERLTSKKNHPSFSNSIWPSSSEPKSAESESDLEELSEGDDSHGASSSSSPSFSKGRGGNSGLRPMSLRPLMTI